MVQTRWRSVASLILLFGVSLPFTGCGKPSDQAETTPVTGKIQFKGKPVEMGTVTFFPVAGGKHATSAIGKEGEFELSTYNPKDGAVLGQHKVTINVSYENPDGTKVPDSVPRVPAKYANVDDTPLTVEVVADGEPMLLELKE